MSKKTSRRAFSYVRFSTFQQIDGGSLNRQTGLTEAYCQRKGLSLDDSLHLQDLGVSAFRGSNVKDGALAGFLEACRVGRVPKGSYLIVESLDRLSRDQIRPALQLFLALQDFGVTIVTLQPEREYPPDATDALALIEPLIVFARAHEESEMKSHRRKHGWKEARDKARRGEGPMLKTCPAWLEVTAEGFRVKEEAAAVVRNIFGWCNTGYGIQRIVSKLTRDNVPPLFGRALGEEEIVKHRQLREKEGVPLTVEEEDDLPRLGRWTTTTVEVNGKRKRVRKWVRGRWVKAYVYRILRNPAAMGTYQPMRQEGKKMVPDGEPVPTYYPAIVTEGEWREAQAAMQQRDGGFETGGRGSPAAGRKGKDDTEANLFTGLVYYAKNGEKMHVTHARGRKGEGERKKYVYLQVTPEKGEQGRRFDYEAFEHAILKKLREIKVSDLAASKKTTDDRDAEETRLSGRLLDLASRIEKTKARARKTEDYDAFLDVLESLQAEHRQVRERLDELQRENGNGTAANLGETHTLIDLLKNAQGEERNELRRRLKQHIRRQVKEIWLLVVPRGRARLAAVQLHFAGSKRQRSYIIYHAPLVRGEPLVESFADVQADGDLDLRRREDAEALAEILEEMDLAEIERRE